MKVKKWLLAFAAFAVMAVVCAVGAGAETYGDFEYEVIDPGNYEDVDDCSIQITKYNGNDVSVDIPDSISGMSVMGIAEHAFYNCTSLKAVTIPASLISIGKEALGYYYDSTDGEVKKVDNFNINYVKNTWGHYYAVENGFSDETCLITKEDVDGFFYIRKYAGHCTSYEIPSEVDGKKITYISGSAFYGSTELTDITIPDSITHIGNYAFFNCTSLKAVTIPASVKDIDVQAFGYYDDNGIDKKLDDFKINYIKNTGGHQYAAKNGFSDEPCLITEEQSDGTLEICGYAGNSTDYAIPSEIEGKKITAIGFDAFNGCTELTSVTIPDSITKIDDRAFYDCTSLKEVAIPASVTDIGWQAFYNCTSLKEVTIPASVTDIGWQAFYNCTSLKEVTIPASVTDIGNQAFGYCVDTVTYNSKKVDGFKINYVKNTQGHLYATQNGFTDEACIVTNELEDGTLEITGYVGNSATYEIPTVIDGKKVTKIGNSAFSGCVELTSVTIPDSVVYIGASAFAGCTLLENIVMPNSLTYIYRGAFSDCSSLKEITIPASVTYIGDEAFFGCSSLKVFTIPASVSHVGEYALGYTYDSSFNYSKLDDFTLQYTKNTAGHLYAARNGFTDESCLFVKENDNGTLTISGYCGNDRSYTIPSDINGKTVTEIGYFAFENSEFTDIEIPDSIETIYGKAFINCANLKSVSIPAGVSLIDEYAFGYLCDDNSVYSKVEDFTLNYVKNTAGHLYAARNGFTDEACLAVNELYDGALEISGYVGNDTEYVIPAEIDGKKVMQIRERAFFECTSLVNIKIPDSVVYIGANAFARCTSLENIVLPNSLTYIGRGAFSYCTSLTKVELPDGVTNIGDSAFYNCNSITSIVIPENVETIGMGAFFNCNQIKSVTIPASVKDVSYNAFGYVYGDNWQYVKSEDFKIYCYKDTAGEQYAKDNGFEYEILHSETPCTHSNTEIRNAVSADCTTEGYTGDTYCVDCDELISSGEVIPATGHTEVIDEAVAATCTKTGLTEGKHCSVCNTVIKAQETVPATGKHSFGDWKITKAATCTAEGTQTRTCSVCGKVETQTIAKVAHKYVDNVVKPTYTAQGYTLHKCSVCGTSSKDTYTAKLTLAQVTGVKLGGRAADALRVNWTKNANADGYIVEMYQGGKWVRVAKITNNSTTTFRKAGLKAGTVYKFRVKAYKMSGKTAVYSEYSTTVAARTNPSVIKGAKLGGRAADALRINWTKNASADGYIVEMYKGNKWVRVAKITNSNTTTFRKAGLKASTVYKFRVRAYKMSGKTALYGNYSATVTARTNPSVMKGVKIGGKAKDALRVNWAKNSSAQGYIVEMYKGGKWVRVAKITNGNTTTFRKAGLAKNTTYKFRVRAYHMSGKTALYGGYGSVSGKTAAK